MILPWFWSRTLLESLYILEFIGDAVNICPPLLLVLSRIGRLPVWLVNKGCFVLIEVVIVVEKFLSFPNANVNSFNVFTVVGAESTKLAICWKTSVLLYVSILI